MLPERAGASSEKRVRASDKDRQDAVNLLHCAYAAGRLDLDEFQERMGAAYTAITWTELRDLAADLPYRLDEARWRQRADAETRRPRPRPCARRRRLVVSLALVSVMMVLLAIASPVPAAAIPAALLAIGLLWAAR